MSAINGEEHQGATSATACRPCRGTGRLISTLGGDSHQVVCPWCRGTGETIPGINSQDAPSEDGVHAQPGAHSGGDDQPAPAQGGVETPEARP